MKIREIHVRKFRNHTHTDAAFGGGTNAILGENGEGKTNLLEAISYLCLTKSFFGSADSIVLQIGETQLDITGELETDSGLRYHVAVSYEQAHGTKRFLINKAPVERMSEVVGQFPMVILSPESGGITTGGPADRRKFLDFVISQASKRYLEDLLEYRRVLRQRNKLLFDVKANRTDCSDLLEPWDEELVDRGARITHRRAQVLREFQPLVQSAYSTIAGKAETPGIRYQPCAGVEDSASEEEMRNMLATALRGKHNEERRLGLTLVGPHRDEVELTINGLGVRSHASQGQHKTLLVALKAAEFSYLETRKKERPVLLLDDIFTELDHHRTQRLLALTHSAGQSFITATSETFFPAGFNWGEYHKRFVVRNGAIINEKTAGVTR